MRHLLGFVLLVLIWGSTWGAIRVCTLHMPVFRSVALRFDLAAVILIAVSLWQRPRLPEGVEWRYLFFFSLFNTVLPFSLVAWASHRISSSMTAILFATTPLIVAWMEVRLPFFGARRSFSVSKVLGLIGGLLGIIVIVCGSKSISRFELSGVAAILCVVFIGSFTSILAKQKLGNIPPLTTTTVMNLFGGLLLSLFSLLFEWKQPTRWDTEAVGAILFLGLISSAVGFLLYYWLLLHLRPYQLAARYFLMPLIALTEGRIMLGEMVTPAMLGGMFLILPSIIPILRAEKMDGPLPLTE